MRLRSILIAATAAVTLAAPALAHRMWLLPSATTLADLGQYVTIDGAISNDLFYADHFPLPVVQVKVWAPDGTMREVENPSTGRYRSTFDVKIDKAGTWKIGTEGTSLNGSFKVNGEEWRVGGRRNMPAPPGGMARVGAAGAPAAMPPREGGAMGGPMGGPPRNSVASAADIPANATDVKLTEVVSSNYVFVSAGEPSTGVFAIKGKGLEMQPVTHPDSLVSDEPAQFRFLIDGKPAAGLKVNVVPGNKKFRAAEQAQELTAGADGLVRVSWPVAGIYWINAVATDNRASTPRATERRMSYTMTVEVPAP